MKRLIVIGDIHAHSNILKLLDKIQITDEDKIIQVGDFLDRGGDHEEVCNILEDMFKKYNMTILLGNHELFYLQEDYFHIIYNNRISSLREFYKKDTKKSLSLKSYDCLQLVTGLIKGNQKEKAIVDILFKYMRKYRSLVIKWINLGRIKLAHSEFGWLLTHAGITDELINQLNWDDMSVIEITDNLNNVFEETYRKKQFDHPVFNTVWTRNHISDRFPQIVGHTPQEKITLRGKHLYVDNGLFVKEDQPFKDRSSLKGLFEPDITIINEEGKIETLKQGDLNKNINEISFAPKKPRI